MFALFALVVSVAYVNAQEIAQPAQAATEVAQEEKVKITADELPAAVKTTLESEDYKGWTIGQAYHHKTADLYEVELKNGAESKTFKFNKDGKKVD